MRAEGFEPVYDKDSELLILGSFPSVKSREISFYYGHPRNRFWNTLFAFFGENPLATVAEKRSFLLAHKIALWDVVTSCEIVGSSDASIREAQIADIAAIVSQSRIRAILCNGSKAYDLFTAHFPHYLGITEKMPSTSPANPRFSAETWNQTLKRVLYDNV